MKLTLRQLEIFLAVAKTENMSRAAEILFLSQSACSMALNSMEQQLEVELFDRYGKKLILNDRGKILFPKAANIIAQVSELPQILGQNSVEQLSGALTIGSSSTIGNYILPSIIGIFITDYPKTHVNLRIDNTSEVIEQLLNFEIDIGFIEGNCLSEELMVLPWRKDELIIIAAPTHPLARKKRVTLNDLKEQRWIFREKGSGTREKFEEAIGTAIIPFLELGHTEAIKQAVETGMGVSCLSKTTVARAIKHGDLVAIPVPFLDLTRELYILFHKQKYQTVLLTEFMRKASIDLVE